MKMNGVDGVSGSPVEFFKVPGLLLVCYEAEKSGSQSSWDMNAPTTPLSLRFLRHS